MTEEELNSYRRLIQTGVYPSPEQLDTAMDRMIVEAESEEPERWDGQS
jgi:hypothetical protein